MIIMGLSLVERRERGLRELGGIVEGIGGVLFILYINESF
jgi:hypothetical protein